MEEKCKNCYYCHDRTNSPFCDLKELYTSVNLEDNCDETDFYGNVMFTHIEEYPLDRQFR